MKATDNIFIDAQPTFKSYPYPEMDFESTKGNEIASKLLETDADYLIKEDAQNIINKIDLTKATTTMFKEIPENTVMRFFGNNLDPFDQDHLDYVYTIKREQNYLFMFQALSSHQLMLEDLALFNRLQYIDLDTGLLVTFGCAGDKKYNSVDIQPVTSQIDFIEDNKINIAAYKLLTYVFLSDVKIVILPIKKSTTVFNKVIGAITNDHSRSLHIVTAKWNTVTFHAGEFGVCGHFRLQPYGPNRELRKLIYIAPFTKHGYTSKRYNPDLE